MCTSGKMNPKESNMNFAVPNKRYLCDTDKNMGKIIPPGVIKQSCKILRNKQNVMILGDIKRILLYGDLKNPPYILNKKLNKLKEKLIT